MDWGSTMSNHVYANMMEVSCKSASGKTICAFPDVCLTPPQTPATPPGVPIPYPNTGMASDTSDGSTTVKVAGAEVMLKNKSCFKKSTGDEAGAAPKKGLVTSKNTGKVYFNAWSMDVKIEGENVARHLDITTHNHASPPGNSPPMPHMDDMSPGGGGDEAEACPVCPAAGNPVNPVQGAKVLADDEDLDFTMDGPFPLTWQRCYRSTSPRVGWFGKGWGSPLEVVLEAVSDAAGRYVDHVDYIDIFGRRISFPSLAPGGHFHLTHEQLTLSRTAQGQYCVKNVDGVTLWFMDREDATYRLSSLTDLNANSIRLEHRIAADGTGTIVVDCSGKQRLEVGFHASRLIQIDQLFAVSSGVQRIPLMRYHYTDRGDLHRVINRAGECTRIFEYTADRLMQRQVYAGMLESWYSYTRDGEVSRVARHWDNVGRSWTFDYQARYTAVTDQDGRVSLYHFDERRRWIGMTDAAGQLTQYGLDAHGNLRAVVDPAEHVTEIIFDERGNPVEYRDASGAVATVEWHPNLVLPLAVTDSLNRTTQYQYDERGNLILEKDPTGAETRYERDERGLVVAIEDANGGVQHLIYNDQAQLVRYIDCLGHSTHFSYDANGWLVGTTDALGQTTLLAYDRAGRLISQTQPDGSREIYENDLAGRLLRLTNGLGATTRYRYTPDGLLSERINALGYVLRYRYDNARKLIELLNENGARYHFVRDILGRVAEETRFDNTRIRYRYDTGNNLIETIEGPGMPEEIVTHYRRDALGRLLERVRAGTHSAFHYDSAGQLIEAQTKEPRTKVQICYDKAGRRIEETVTTPERAHILRHKYDALGNRVSMTLPDGTKLGTVYDAGGGARQLQFNGDALTDIGRDPLAREVNRTQGSLTTTTAYDRNGRIRHRLSYPTATPSGSQADIGGGPIIIERSYQYDTTDRLTFALDRDRRLAYGYDALDRLLRFNEERFAFDPAHNLVPADNQTGAATGVVMDNRLLVYADIRYRYDLHGRVTEKQVGGRVTIQFKWNDEHRLIESTTHDQFGSHTTQYVYDAFGRRIAKRSAQGTTWFVWDKDRLLQESRDIDEYTFLYEPDSFVPLARAVKKSGLPATQIHYFHCDQIGLPRELTDRHGNISWEGKYLGWGRLSSAQAWGEGSDTAAAVQPLRFQGEYSDEETGLHYSLMRYYDPDGARFVSKDPIGLMGGINEYQYSPNPTGWIDPWGLTGTYIFTNGTIKYIGKGPKERFQQSQRARLRASCPATAAVHQDYGDDDMGYMVEHLLMSDYGAQAAPDFANSANLSSPGKKKYAAASKAKQQEARRNANKLKKAFKKAGGC